MALKAGLFAVVRTVTCVTRVAKLLRVTSTYSLCSPLLDVREVSPPPSGARPYIVFHARRIRSARPVDLIHSR